jgi:hypothetical protein
MPRQCAIVLAAAAAIVLGSAVPDDAHAAGTVGTGSAASCTEASFDAALVGGGAIDFDCGGPATITFTATKSITVATSIDGSPGIVLSGGNAVRLFNVTGGSLAIDGLTLDAGRDTPAQPGAAAINASAPVQILNSTISNHQTSNGGCPAIAMSGATLTITRSTVTGNVNSAAAQGFAVCGNNTSDLQISLSTFSGNTGGAIMSSGSSTVYGSTIAGNTSTGGGNTGGLQVFGASGAMNLGHSVVASNVGTGQCSTFSGGVINDQGSNLQFPDNACGATISVLDPRLGPLASNGGPTQTMALLPGSPAIDGGLSLVCPLADQRGVPPQDGDGNGTVVCDVGAYEAPTFIPPREPNPVPINGQALAVLAMLLTLGAASALRRRARRT